MPKPKPKPKPISLSLSLSLPLSLSLHKPKPKPNPIAPKSTVLRIMEAGAARVCCGEEPPPGTSKQCMRGHALPSLQAVVTGYPPLAKTEHKPRMECTGCGHTC